MPVNPFDYDDDEYTQATIELQHAISRMWAAGATEENIANEVENAIENAQDEA